MRPVEVMLIGFAAFVLVMGLLSVTSKRRMRFIQTPPAKTDTQKWLDEWMEARR